MFPPGVYETLVTELQNLRLAESTTPHTAAVQDLRNAEAADRLAYHLAAVVERVIDALPERDRARAGVTLVRTVVETLAAQASMSDVLGERPVDPGKVLRSINRLQPDGSVAAADLPLIPLLDTALLTNAPGEPRVGHQIHTEIASADRIDIVMAFVRRTGIAPLREALRRHVEAGRVLRVLTTTYTGSTEVEALEWLQQLGGQVRVSYDTSSTRLHAKAWLFHRESGFSTAYVGSSNLTHSAQVSGLEWNVRVSGARNRTVIDKVAAVFESYWQQPDFEDYDLARFTEMTRAQTRNDASLVLSPVEIRLEPFQERLLEQVQLARQLGHHRNLLVSATGTGKTVMAAVDYARLRSALPRARLLFVAHREEILIQSRATFAHALRDGSFGELWVGGRRPQQFEHVFASIQSLAANDSELDPSHFDVVIIDEFHHAAASTYTRLLSNLEPVELLGLTATPERSDGVSILHWFGDRIAAELRLWDAIDQHRLTPFSYYGIADDLDLRQIPWSRGKGYDVEGLTNVITANDVWARKVAAEFARRVGSTNQARALGFCVSVEHARYMARVFNECGIASVATWSKSTDVERNAALVDLAAGRINAVFSVDLFNEGVDVPSVDVLLMLRPTESPLLFLQQFGRGLRKHPGKTVCSVLDFVGQHRKEFRYDLRFRALLGGSRTALVRHVEQGFPFLPAGCHMELDHVASERVLRSIQQSVPSRWPEKVAELRHIASEYSDVPLASFLELAGLDLEDVYTGSNTWSDLKEQAGLAPAVSGPDEKAIRRACGRLLHVDDAQRLDKWRTWVARDEPPRLNQMTDYDARLLRMLVAQLVDQVGAKGMTLDEGASLIWSHAQVRSELVDLFKVLEDRLAHVVTSVASLPTVPLKAHARYTRLEILAACGVGSGAHVSAWQTGVYFVPSMPADLFAFTLDKTVGQFSPSTRYRDYAVSRELIHWESQSVTRQDSETGTRYQQHEAIGSHILLFARLNSGDRSFYCLGPATYVSHSGERPMAITWRLHHPLPGDLFQAFAAAVA